jgi:hypothetical protein
MASDRKVRASDADRDQAAAALREHLVAGRLTVDEFDERLGRAYAAKTLGELDDLMADLPVADLVQFPDASLRPSPGDPPRPGPGPAWPAQAGRSGVSPARRAAWGSWLTISLFLITIWVISGGSGSLWFLWMALALGALMLGRWVLGVPAHRRRRVPRSWRS